MLSTEGRRRLAAGGMFILPLFLVKATSVMLGGAGPVETQAATTEDAPIGTTQVIAGPKSNEEAQILAAEHITSLENQPFGVSPMYYETHGQVESTEIEHPEEDPPPQFKIRGILSASAGNTALIDGKPYRVGDELADSGWRITEIDGVARSVTIKDSKTGRTETRTVQ